MDEHAMDATRLYLGQLVEAATQPARLALLLDDRQPDRLRIEAMTMPPERLCWTLTQLDDGLDLALCQALVRASRLARGRRVLPDRLPGQEAAEDWSAETAATVAQGWALRRLVSLPSAVAIAYWLAAAGGTTTLAASDPAPADAAAQAHPWLDIPPIVGPPPGAEDWSFSARLRRCLRRLGGHRQHDEPPRPPSDPA